ncbi:MAG: Dam family site-specific DNA-(adenine-N6)-methyltransferase [Methanobrevibacter sp.]|nr:Dam family site-specific DNA-(adenine-N6)-methyltransferase [Methanobrevibacter sp.]
MQYIKSPFNYIGNKYRTLPQIEQWFPENINTMLDLFCGGCDVSINTMAKRHLANDINTYLIQILQTFKTLGSEKVLAYVDQTIASRGLSKENAEAYLKFRDEYNAQNPKSPIDLYILLCFSFNYQFRFNANHDFNNPFGRNRSSFNPSIRHNLELMIKKLPAIEFSSIDFLHYDYSVLNSGDFLYADPPYLITCGSYNDGKRGFRGWSAEDEKALYHLLNDLNNKGIKFALSNVTTHKGMQNKLLLDWIKKYDYNVHNVNFNYDNCNYHAANRHYQTNEVLITNY